jgi:serine/threonine protein kinase
VLEPGGENQVNLPAEIAGYRIVRLLGEGGMSVVYAAMQKQPKRLVALKVLKGSVFPPSTLRRFKQEVEILGKLRHPGIAQVFDAGTWDDGSGEKPYFVMEHIPGGRELDVYLDERDAGIEDRLKIFVRVCAAIEHGHQRQVIHRDLKPANILVDEQGMPKVIDYGVARVSEVEIDAKTMHTEAGRLVGTVQYMAPEQVDMAMRDIDGRCDVYALGVLLYQLLLGRLPHELEGQPLFEAMRVIREDAPLNPRRLNASIESDLETIMLTCLEKERSRRYATAGELGRDIVRYLKHEPISARRPSLAYRARLFTRRHRTAVLAGAAVFVALVAAILASTLLPGWLNADREASLQEQIDQEQSLRIQAESERDVARASSPNEFHPVTPFALRGLDSPAMLLATSGSDDIIAAASSDAVAAWSLPDTRRRSTGDTGELSPRLMSMSLDGRVLAVAGAREIVVIDLVEGRDQRWNLLRRDPVSLAVNSDGSIIAIAFPDFSMSLFTPSGRSLGRVTSTTGNFTFLAFGASGHLAGSTDSRLTVWTIDPGPKEARRYDLDFPGEQLDLAVDPGNGSILMLDSSGSVTSFSTDGSTPPSRRAVSMGQLVSGSFDPAGGGILAIESSTMYVVDLATNELRTPSMPLPVTDVPYVLGPGGSFIAHGTPTGEVALIPLEPHPPGR